VKLKTLLDYLSNNVEIEGIREEGGFSNSAPCGSESCSFDERKRQKPGLFCSGPEKATSGLTNIRGWGAVHAVKRDGPGELRGSDQLNARRKLGKCVRNESLISLGASKQYQKKVRLWVT